MEKMKITEEQVRSISEEVERRLQMKIEDAIHDGIRVTPAMIRDMRADYLQGVYSTLKVLSCNWSAVTTMIMHQEEEMHWRDLGYYEE